MIDVKTQWNPKQALLKDIIPKADRFDEAIQLCLEMHSMVHTSEMSEIGVQTFEDLLWDGLDEITFRTVSTDKGMSIAWNIWHSTWIEDITVNILIADDIQVINDSNWPDKMNVSIRDTGNAMAYDEIIKFSSSIDMMELKNYRAEVGRKTRKIIKELKQDDLKRKFELTRLQRILNEGGVLKVEGTQWLIDFWGRKTVAGILLMPITRHQIVHLNDSLRLKEKCIKKIRKK